MRARRREIVDEYVEDGRAAVYSTEGMVLLLSELATSAWALLGEEWTPVESLAEQLVREYGEPGDGLASHLTEQTLASLAERGLVEVDHPESAS